MSVNPAVPDSASIQRPTRARWMILAMLFVVTTVNFADRATIALAAPDLSQALHLSPVQMGYIFSAFSWSYVLSQLPGGWLLDRFGSKTIYGMGLALWSLFTLFQGFVGLLTGGAAIAVLFMLRLAVGVAEAPALPGNGRITSAWFPTQERGFASAIFSSAQYFGTALFAPIMGWIVHALGWQSVFWVMGGLGLLLALMWPRTIYGPTRDPRINQGEIDYIRAGGALVDLDEAAKAQQPHALGVVRTLLLNRMLFGIYLYQYCINVMTYFFLTWFPIYLVTERHMTIVKAGMVASLPALCGFAGGILGGYVSDRLIRAGWTLTAARKTPIAVGMMMAMSMIGCVLVKSDTMVIVFMSLAFLGKGIGALGWAVIADTSPPQAGGLSGALFNTFGNVAGIVTPIVVGYILQSSGSFAGAIVFVGCNAALALFSMMFVVQRIERMQL